MKSTSHKPLGEPAAVAVDPARAVPARRRVPSVPLRTPVTQHALERMQNLIAEGAWAEGTRIPSQRELADSLGVSRSSLREAISSLEGMGLVRVEPGRGVFVSAIDDDVGATRNARVHEIDHTPAELYEARLLMEGWAAALAAVYMTEPTLRKLRELVAAMGDTVASHDVARLNQLDFEFHSIISMSCQNKLVRSLLAPIYSEEQMSAPHILDTAFLSSRIREHEQIVDALATRDPNAAQRAMRNHILRSAKRVQVQLPEHVHLLP
ncbi:FadR/GntR family transcriptional regulator [Bordetella genomosp. 10]|nr:FadR/GntR family transcriptional regulator [Bordetella genomosp. 10]